MRSLPLCRLFADMSLKGAELLFWQPADRLMPAALMRSLHSFAVRSISVTVSVLGLSLPLLPLSVQLNKKRGGGGCHTSLSTISHPLGVDLTPWQHRPRPQPQCWHQWGFISFKMYLENSAGSDANNPFQKLLNPLNGFCCTILNLQLSIIQVSRSTFSHICREVYQPPKCCDFSEMRWWGEFTHAWSEISIQFEWPEKLSANRKGRGPQCGLLIEHYIQNVSPRCLLKAKTHKFRPNISNNYNTLWTNSKSHLLSSLILKLKWKMQTEWTVKTNTLSAYYFKSHSSVCLVFFCRTNS